MNDVQCANCIEWEYFEGCGYGCFVMRTMMPFLTQSIRERRNARGGGEQE